MQASEFASHIHSVKPSGKEFIGLCPSHDDRTASLSWRDGEKGLVVTCHAGCTIEAITGALGVKTADLFTVSPNGYQPPPSPEGRVIASYPYHDERGTLLYEAVRKEPKKFIQRQPDGKGGWIWNITSPAVRHVLYRLPSLQGQAEIWICEGEKDCDRLAAAGLTATTNPMGAGKWKPDYTAQLQASGVKRVVILPDNDPAGEAHVKTVAESCRAAGLIVKIITLPGLPPKGDVSWWLDAGHTVEELRRLVTQTGTVENRDRIVPIAEAVRAFVDSLESAAPEFVTTPFQNLNKLLCGGLVPGELCYLAAKGGEGKSALALELARHVSSHQYVLVVSQEMGLAALVRRFIAQESGVSATRLRQHNLLDTDWARITHAAGTLSERKIGLVDHAPTVEKIRARVRESPGVKLVIVDYLQLLTGEGRDGRAQLESVSKGLKDIAKRENIVIFCLSAVSARGEHNSKPSMHWLRGSGMLEHDCDVTLLLHQPDPKDPARELIVAKARDAMVGSVMLHFSKDIVHFVEQELHREEPAARRGR